MHKAQAETVMIVMIAGMVLGLAFVVFYATISDFPDTGVIGDEKPKILSFLQAMDMMYFFLIIGFTIFGIITARTQTMVRGLLPISLLILCILIPLGGTLADIFLRFTSKETLATALTNLPVINFCQNNWPAILTCISLIIFVAYYSKQEDTYV